MSIVEPYKIKHRLNQWDYESMGLKISELLDFNVENGEIIDFNSYKDYCISNNIDHSITRIKDKEKGNALSKLGFKNVETSYGIRCRVSNLKNLNYKNKKNKHIKVDCDIEELSNLASTIFNYGRFAEDSEIGKELSDKRNHNWVRDLYNSENNRKFLFIREKLAGFMFYENENNKTNLILGGISPQYLHLADYFWSNVFLSLPKNSFVETNISAKNLGVINLYSLFGFKFFEVKDGYHKKWRKNDKS